MLELRILILKGINYRFQFNDLRLNSIHRVAHRNLSRISLITHLQEKKRPSKKTTSRSKRTKIRPTLKK